jgi:hypothetical protein
MTDDTQTGYRHRIKGIFGNSYVFISETDIMLVVADENNPQHAPMRAMGEAVCRLASKAMAAGLPMLAISEQLRAADSGRCTILSDLAMVMEQFVAKSSPG